MAGIPLKPEKISLELNDFKKSSEKNSHQIRRYKLVKLLLDKIKKKGRGLDYGCGLGDITYNFSSQFDEIIGVDVNLERVEWANKEFSPIKFYPCDEVSLDFKNESFDTVLSIVVINWADSPLQYLQNISNVLKNEGHMLIIVANSNPVRKFFRNIVGKKSASEHSFDEYCIKDMKNMLEQTNFKILEIDSYYDPLDDISTSPKNLLMEFLNIPMRLLNIPNYANYYGILAQKNS